MTCWIIQDDDNGRNKEKVGNGAKFEIHPTVGGCRTGRWEGGRVACCVNNSAPPEDQIATLSIWRAVHETYKSGNAVVGHKKLAAFPSNRSRLVLFKEKRTILVAVSQDKVELCFGSPQLPTDGSHVPNSIEPRPLVVAHNNMAALICTSKPKQKIFKKETAPPMRGGGENHSNLFWSFDIFLCVCKVHRNGQQPKNGATWHPHKILKNHSRLDNIVRWNWKLYRLFSLLWRIFGWIFVN